VCALLERHCREQYVSFTPLYSASYISLAGSLRMVQKQGSTQAPNIRSRACFSRSQFVGRRQTRPASRSAYACGASAEVRLKEASTHLSGLKSRVTGMPDSMTRVPLGRFCFEYSCGGLESVDVPEADSAQTYRVVGARAVNNLLANEKPVPLLFVLGIHVRLDSTCSTV
jgi:hypothetical protein